MSGAVSPVIQYAFMTWCPVKTRHRDNFTFTLTVLVVKKCPDATELLASLPCSQSDFEYYTEPAVSNQTPIISLRPVLILSPSTLSYAISSSRDILYCCGHCLLGISLPVLSNFVIISNSVDSSGRWKSLMELWWIRGTIRK
jgi:hypothetical protein